MISHPSLPDNDPIGIDFETAMGRGYSLQKMSLEEYLADPRFDAYLVAFATADKTLYIGHPDQAPWDMLEGRTLVAHNAGFERAVIRRLQQLGRLPQFTPGDWHDTADLCVYLQVARSLKKAVEYLLPGEGKIEIDLEKASDEEREKYCAQDARLCARLWRRWSRYWPEVERTLSSVTTESAERGVRIDLELLEESRNRMLQLRQDLTKRIPWTEDREGRPARKALSIDAMREECKALGIAAPPTTAKGDARFERWAEEHGHRAPWIRDMRRLRSVNRVTSVLNRIRDRAHLRGDSVIRTDLLYFGAAVTGRWAGTGDLNFQNYNREETEGVNLRHLFRARVGHKLIVADLAQIEPRVLAWTTGNIALLEMVAQGVDLYEAFGRTAMGWTGGKLKDERPDLRHLYKAMVLGLGYGCGADRFELMAPALTGGAVNLTKEQATQAVWDYREANIEVTRRWQRLEDWMAKEAGRTFKLRLPSGRLMRYFDVADNAGRLSAKTRLDGKPAEFYGGKLVENETQAIARDVFGLGLARMTEWTIPILWTTHDEVIAEAPIEAVEWTLETTRRALTDPPEWAPGLPLACEAIVCDRYEE